MTTANKRILSGMRPTGLLHLGHYHGVLKNWIKLQQTYDCFFFVADWHALTTHYEDPSLIEKNNFDMVVDWLAAGVNPKQSKIFIQSKVPEHAELNLLLSMITPLSWLERVPSYKDQQEMLKEKDLATFGFLGYPLLQSADILMYKAAQIPVGEDQVAHIELTREVARRFNHIYGKEIDFEKKSQIVVKKMGKKNAKLFNSLKKNYQEKGDKKSLESGRVLLLSQQNISNEDKERLFGYLEGSGKIILPEPKSLLTKASKMPGLDGQKMSKSYGNTISLRETPEEIEKKIRTMPTDTARVRRTDLGNPDNCPVWQLHNIYSKEDTKKWVKKGCKEAGIGCIECKQPIIDAIKSELVEVQYLAKQYISNPNEVNKIITEGVEAARVVAKETLTEVKTVMGINY